MSSIAVQNRMTRCTILSYTLVFLIFAMLIFSGLSAVVINYNIYFQAAAQTANSPDLAKVLVDSAVQTLQSGNVNNTIMHSRAAELELILLAFAQVYVRFLIS